MRIERTDKEIIIRIPADVDIAELDKILDYIKFRAIASKSAASDREIDELAKESKSTWWEENKKRFVE